MGIPLIEASQLSCARAGRLIFSSLSFTLQKGSVLIVTGKNGVGKTSLLRVVCGLLQPTSGELFFRGIPFAECDEGFMTQMVYIGHRAGIKLGLTPRENMAFNCGIFRCRPGVHIDQVLERVGLIEARNLTTAQLSAGQRQRLALARLLLVDAPLWILDEPMATLDCEGVALIQQMISQQTRSDGGVILATHQRIPLDVERMSNLEIKSCGQPGGM